MFSKLSYNNKKVKAERHPTDALNALYKKKEQDYNYVIDNSNKIETALNNIPFIEHSENDKNLLQNAKKTFKDTFDSFGNALEDRVVDTKNLANDINNNFGLKEIQASAENRSKYIKGLKERYDKGEITKQRLNGAISYSDSQYKGVEKDAKTGLFTGGYSGRDVADYINVGEKVNKFLSGFKSNKYTIKLGDKDIGFSELQKTDKGYLVTGTKEEVSEADLINAAKSHLKQDAKVQEQFNEDIFYELQGKEKVTATDIQNLLANGSTSKEILDALDLKTVEDLNKLKEKGVDLENIYRTIRKDQLTNEAISGGVEKESFVEYGKKYMKPLDFSNKGGSNKKLIEKGLVTVTKISTNQALSPADMSQTFSGITATKSALDKTRLKLQELENLKNSNQDVSEGSIANLKREIINYNKQLDTYDRKLESISNNVAFQAERAGVPLDKLYRNYTDRVQKTVDRKVQSILTKFKRQKGELSLANIGEGDDTTKLNRVELRKALNEKYKKEKEILNKKEFEKDVFIKYSQNDVHSSLLGNRDLSSTDEATRAAATELQRSLGKMEHLKVVNPNSVFSLSSLSNTGHRHLKEYVSLAKGLIKDVPENFKIGDKNLRVLLSEVDNPERIDRKRIRVLAGTDKNEFTLNIPYTEFEGETAPPLQLSVNYTGEELGAVFQKVLVDEAEVFVNKLQNNEAKEYDINTLRNFGRAYLDTTPAGDRLAELDLRTAKVGERLDWKIKDDKDPRKRVSIGITPKISEAKNTFGSQVFELNIYKDNMLATYGKNKQGEIGWYTEDELVLPKTFEDANGIQKEIGAVILEDEVKKKLNNNILNSNKNITTDAIIKNESNGDPNAVSKVGATGLMQIMPSDSKGGSPLIDFNRANNTNYTDSDLTSPEINRQIGEWYYNNRIPSMLNTNNLPDKPAYRLIAYNWGIGNLKNWHKNGANINALPKETRDYLIKFLK